MRVAVLAAPIGALLAACGGHVAGGPSTTTGAVPANATVEWVVDGDTVDVLVGARHERVRLIGIDTPETAHASDGARGSRPAECFGPEAQAFTEALLPIGSPVRIERDVVGRDDYGRILGYVYRADDGLFANYELARQGFARPLTIPPNVAHADRFVEAARAAERVDAGLWSACSE